VARFWTVIQFEKILHNSNNKKDRSNLFLNEYCLSGAKSNKKVIFMTKTDFITMNTQCLPWKRNGPQKLMSDNRTEWVDCSDRRKRNYRQHIINSLSQLRQICLAYTMHISRVLNSTERFPFHHFFFFVIKLILKMNFHRENFWEVFTERSS
jgi:hypothetical protein